MCNSQSLGWKWCHSYGCLLRQEPSFDRRTSSLHPWQFAPRVLPSTAGATQTLPRRAKCLDSASVGDDGWLSRHHEIFSTVIYLLIRCQKRLGRHAPNHNGLVPIIQQRTASLARARGGRSRYYQNSKGWPITIYVLFWGASGRGGSSQEGASQGMCRGMRVDYRK